ncbi:MAG: 4-hydroxy-tetrahydrodipicolinate synthase [Firmicutes bacterium]|nr:4-hydroxy-tetrahydrodipicolinate synthase [Bacillota bacterium]
MFERPFRGSMVALITPFNEDGSVNFNKLKELVDFHIAEGTDSILALGTTAETPTLTMAESDEIVKTVISQANGRVPILVGSGSNNTMMAKELSLKYENMGADGLLVITPYYNKCTDAGLIDHFYTVADAVHSPIWVYHVPGRTGVKISYNALSEISKHPNIVGLKEASGDMSLVTKYAKLINDDFNIYSGNDDINVPVLSVGGAGVISVLANILPGVTHGIVMDYLNGDVKKARDEHLKHLDFINALFIETNPIPIKEAMNMVGMDVGGFRKPLVPMEPENKAVLEDTMRELGLI